MIRLWIKGRYFFINIFKLWFYIDVFFDEVFIVVIFGNCLYGYFYISKCVIEV